MKKTMFEIFNEGLTDCRRENAVRYKLIDIIIIGILTIITGGKGFTDMSTFGKSKITRKGHAAENLNTLIHMALNLLKSEKTSKRGMAGKMYECALNTEYLKNVLGQNIDLQGNAKSSYNT